MSSGDPDRRLHERDRVLAGTLHAMECARARGERRVEPDDLLAGILSAVASDGKVRIGALSIDLPALGLSLPISEPLARDPIYSPATAAIFDDAARIARHDGFPSPAPVHFLIAIGEAGTPLFHRLLAQCDVDLMGWRVALAGVSDRGAAQMPAAGASPRWVALDTAAARLGRSTDDLKKSIAAGRLAAFRVAGDRVLRVREDDLEGLPAG